MSMTMLYQIAFIPSLLIMVAGMLILHSGDQAKARRRFLFFLVTTESLLLLILLITSWIGSEPGNESVSQLATLLIPSIIGVFALVALNLKHVAGMKRSAQIWVGLLVLAQVIVLYLLRNDRLGILYFILPGAPVLIIGWVLGRRNRWTAVALSFFALLVLSLFYQQAQNPQPLFAEPPPDWLSILFQISLYAIPILMVVMPAVFITTILQDMTKYSESTVNSNHLHWSQIFRIGLVVILLGYLAYVIYWGSVWDHTSDGLFGIAITMPAGIAAVGAGMVMAVVLPGKYRLGGLAFMVLAPLLLFQAFDLGWRVSYHDITEGRAAQIAQALDQFHSREGHYPETLSELTPRDLLFIEQPVILIGQTWCYQSGSDFYRLGAFYREYFSSPVSLHIYETAGEPPSDQWDCDGREAAVLERYPSPMDNPAAFRPSLPTALPASDLAFPKTEIQPLLDGVTAVAGSWSPDSAYFFFGTQISENGMNLRFLTEATGNICTVSGQFTRVDNLRRYHAWLPDGRVFYIDSTGKIIIITPCTDEVTDLTDHFDDTFTQIGAYAPETGRLLLESKASYWILDSSSLMIKQIVGVTPNPYDFHWDNFAWLPGGDRLAISHLNGRDQTTGSTLYLVAGETGQVEKNIALDEAYDQSAPWVDGLATQQVLIHGNGDLILIDFSTNPPEISSVLQDIFNLDIDYPNEVHAAGSLIDADRNSYYLIVRVNHPRNHGLYLYHAADHSIQVIDNEVPTLLLFPDGQLWWDYSQLGTEPDYIDDYAVIDMGSGKSTSLSIPGHTPRSYPTLSLSYLARTSQIAAASSQGISLQSLADGELTTFWTLAGEGFAPNLMAAPDGSALVAMRDYGGLFWMRLD